MFRNCGISRFTETHQMIVLLLIFGICVSAAIARVDELSKVPQAVRDTILRETKGFEIEEFHAVQDLNWTNRAVFLCLLACHIFTRLPGLWRLRTNIVVLLRKKS